MELKDLLRETRALPLGTIAHSGRAYLIEESRRRDAKETETFATDAAAFEEQMSSRRVTHDVAHRPVYVLARGDGRPGPVVVGRGDECDVCVPVTSISVRHASFQPGSDGCWSVRDLGSRNGTFVEGHRLEGRDPEPIREGASIRIGPELVLTFLDGRAMERLLLKLRPVLARAEAKAAASEDARLPGADDPFATPARPIRPVAARVQRGARLDRPRKPADPEALSLACPPHAAVGLVPGIPVAVGRAASNGLVLAHPQVSSAHARFERTESSIVVVDLGSRNGTRVDGRRVERAELAPGSRVEIGPFTIVIARSAAPPPLSSDIRRSANAPAVASRPTQARPRPPTL